MTSHVENITSLSYRIMKAEKLILRQSSQTVLSSLVRVHNSSPGYKPRGDSPSSITHFTSIITLTVNLHLKQQPPRLKLFPCFLRLQVQQRRRNVWATTTSWSDSVPPSDWHRERCWRCLVSCLLADPEERKKERKKERRMCCCFYFISLVSRAPLPTTDF